MTAYHLQIVTPEGTAYNDQVNFLSAPGQEGNLGVLANHAPMITLLKRGILKLEKDQGAAYYAINSGILEVDAGSQVLVLADRAVAAGTEIEAAEKLTKLNL